jgi:hypothetical protein
MARLGDLDTGTAVAAADTILAQQGGVDKQFPASAFPLPINYIGGLITSNNGSDADHDIDIAIGSARSADNSDNLHLTTALTKQIDAAWAVGTNQGGLDTGSVAADTMYAIWLIKRPDTGIVDVLFSTSFTSPTMPANYTKKRLIAAIRTKAGSADIIAYLQSDNYFRYMGEQPQDVNDNTMTHLTYETGTLSVPPSCMAHIYGNLSNAGSSTASDGRMWIKTKGATNQTDNTDAWIMSETSATIVQFCSEGQVLVDANSQVEYACREVTGTATMRIRTLGFTMLTRNNP